MDDQPSTLGSEHTIRPSMPNYQPLRKTRLGELSDRKPFIHSPSGLNPAASPFKVDSLPSGSTPQPSTYENCSSQQDYPSNTTQHHSNDLDATLPPTFFPPDSPDPSSAGGVDLNPEGNTIQNMRASSSSEYTGITMPSGRLGNLTTHGALASINNPSETLEGHCDSSSGDDLGDLPFTPSSARGKSNPNSITATPNRKWLESDENTALRPPKGQVYDTSRGVSLYDIASQTKTFAQLSREQGFRDWNNSVFDDRWGLRPDETWKRDGSRQSAFMISPDSKSSERSHSYPSNMGSNEGLLSYNKTSLESSQGRHHAENVFKGDSVRLQQPTPTRRNEKQFVEQICWDKGTHSKSAATVLRKEDEGFSPLPPEIERFNTLRRDIHAELHQLPYSPRIIRRYFYQRCFGDGEGPAPLSGEENKMLTKYCGRPTTLARLRDELMENIEDLILYLMAPGGESMAKGTEASGKLSSPTYLDQAHSTADSTNSILPSEQRRLTDHGLTSEELSGGMNLFTSVRNHEDGKEFDREEDDKARREKALADLQQMLDEGNLRARNIDRLPLKRDGGPTSSNDINVGNGNNRFGQTGADPHISRISVASKQDNLPSAFGRMRLGQIDEEPSPYTPNGPRSTANLLLDDERFYFTPGRSLSRFDGSLSNEASQSVLPSPSTGPWSSLNTSVQPTPYQSPDKPQYGGFSQQHFPPGANINLTPAQFQYIGHQQMQHGMANNVPFPYGQQQSTGFRTPPGFLPGSNYGPNGIWVPHDRYVRPPATNRIAPMLAQNNMWQASQQRQASNIAQHPEWQSRFGSPAPAISRDSRKLPYLEGSDDMYPQPPLGGGASVRFQNLTRNQPPGLDAVKDEANLPFVETARASKPAEWGVMKIGNIPYDLTKASVITFLGNHAKIITPELGPSVHIMMDRATGKTQDCYVEFFSVLDARAWVNVINNRTHAANRIGDRTLEVQLSSQDELLKELFPRAKNVSWEGGKPVIMQSDDPYNSGFKTFLFAEELQNLVSHVEKPHKSNFTIKCPGRPYEAMISLLAKFPWQATEHYNLALRNKIFDAALKMLHVLNLKLHSPSGSRNTSLDTSPIDAISPVGAFGGGSGYNTPGGYAHFLPRQGGGPKPLENGLLRDLLSAALNASGFSEKQRWELYHTADVVNRSFFISPLAQQWPFEVLGRKRGMEEDVVEWYAQLIANHPSVSPSVTGSSFGNLAEWFGEIKDTTSMDEVGGIEWDVMVKTLMHQCT